MRYQNFKIEVDFWKFFRFHSVFANLLRTCPFTLAFSLSTFEYHFVISIVQSYFVYHSIRAKLKQKIFMFFISILVKEASGSIQNAHGCCTCLELKIICCEHMLQTIWMHSDKNSIYDCYAEYNEQWVLGITANNTCRSKHTSRNQHLISLSCQIIEIECTRESVFL